MCSKFIIFCQNHIKSFFNKKRFKQLIGGGFHFSFFSFILIALLFFSSSSLAKLSYIKNGDVFTLNSSNNDKDLNSNDLFINQNGALSLETPDLKIIEDNFVYGISTPNILTTQTLGNIFFGESSQNSKEVINYAVELGDTIASVAQKFNISSDTLLWANNLAKNSSLKVGQNLVILPTSGIIHIVKSGDTISQISKIYKSTSDDIISFNGLASEGDIFIGDILIIPGGIMPKKPVPSIAQTLLPDSFFIYPTEGRITQGLHYYNAVDVANKCGTPVYAAASGTVQRARYGWNSGGGNQVTVLHSGGIVTYYGHLLSISVKSGDQVVVGDRIGLMGQSGISTGCHVHFEVIGAKNPLVKYIVGTILGYK